ncbi:response regulator [Microcoleus sp. FACHB-1515]|uniref:ATP-binding protein n=1 Tax=Cyanophyceae TaxID=3028117 RepID=UPI001684DD2D|nr:ATP-binding protein [Microcoleus sp. FACHB-1515]MBD2089273.1 response regulator [Microcoleus sp. FACHB-1515]
MTGSAQGKATPNIFGGGGEMGELMRSTDWSQTPVGSVQSWSQSLKSLVKTLLTSRYPMVLTWGAAFTQFYNDAYSQLIGDKHPAALGTDIRETLAEAWDTLGPMIQRVMATGVANWTEALLLVLERAGYREESYFSVSHAPAEDDDGQIVGMLAVCSEVTQQVLGERRLRLLRDLASKAGEMRSVQDTCQDLMAAIAAHPLDVPFALLYLRDSDGKTLTLQGAVGLAADEQLCPHSVNLATSHQLWSFAPVASGETILVEEFDRQMTVPGGPWNEPVHTALMMPIASSGQTAPLGVLVAGVNPNRALDEGYRSFYELLVGQVSVSIRNAQAYEEERRRAEMLAELDRAKTAFFSNISHEFRTPLTLMLNPLEEMLQGDRLPSVERSQIAVAYRNALRLLKLVNTLLDFSRIEAGRTQARLEPIDLVAYTSELASLFQSTIEQAGLQFTVDCPPLPERIDVDREMWEKIVLNLLSNAFKFTFAGEIAVSLCPIGDQVELSVRDTGTGVPAEEIPRLFERFHRVEGTRGRTFEGTGIGLSLVQELVHLHGGTIAVESRLGEGSTFRVRLPMKIASAESDRHTASSTQPADSATSYVQEASGWLPANAPSAQSAQRSSAARIFLVDDNADMRNYLHRILSECYQVEVFSEGTAALNAARTSVPDLVLSDVMMPGMDGFELLRQLRRDPQTCEIPILLLSARAGEESAVEGLNAGADDYLVKPFSTRELLARVASNVELGRSRRATARRRIDQVLASVPDLIYTFDLSGRFTYVNQPLLDLWQKTYAEAIGKTLFELDYPPELAARLHQQIQQVIATGQSLRDETPYTSGFETRAYEYIFVPLLNAEGAVEAVAGVGRDITDRKQTEAALRQSEERFRTLISASSNVLYRMSADWRELQELRGGNFIADTPEPSRDWLQKYIHPDDHERVLAAIDSAIQTKSLFELEHRVRQVDGTFGWTYSRAVPLLDSAGEIIEWFGEANDITVAKHLEEGRKRIEQEREQILQREQTAREAAERANQIKDEFLAVLSHELRTPLNPILGWSRLLRSGKLDAEKSAQAAEIIERNTKLQVQLIEDLLDISRILRGKLSLNLIPVNLKVAINPAIETVRLAIDAKAIALQTQFDSVGQVKGDVARLQQVVWNLVSNAVKFTPPKGKITVTLTQVGSDAQIQVIDTGKGIHPDFLPYVFEHFRQEDGATTRKFGGLGLGLAIARQIVELHGGTIQAESAGEDQGATFTVKLPLLEDAGAAAERKETQHSLTSSHSPLKNLRVLVVDDEMDTRELTAFVLEQAGAIVTAVPSAIAALNVFVQSPPDVLVSDIGMPDMDGYELMRQLRHRQGDRVPAVALTAYAGEINQQQAIAAGFHIHLSKPIEPEQLIGAICTLCDRSAHA